MNKYDLKLSMMPNSSFLCIEFHENVMNTIFQQLFISGQLQSVIKKDIDVQIIQL